MLARPDPPTPAVIFASLDRPAATTLLQGAELGPGKMQTMALLHRRTNEISPAHIAPLLSAQDHIEGNSVTHSGCGGSNIHDCPARSDALLHPYHSGLGFLSEFCSSNQRKTCANGQIRSRVVADGQKKSVGFVPGLFDGASRRRGARSCGDRFFQQLYPFESPECRGPQKTVETRKTRMAGRSTSAVGSAVFSCPASLVDPGGILRLNILPEGFMGETGSRSKALSGRFQNPLQLRGVAHEQAFQIFLALRAEEDCYGLAVARHNDRSLLAGLQIRGKICCDFSRRSNPHSSTSCPATDSWFLFLSPLAWT